MTGEHIDADGQFRSDKYLWCKPGFVPLKITDKMAQDLLAEYAKRRKVVDLDFSADLWHCLLEAGYRPEGDDHGCDPKGTAYMRDAGVMHERCGTIMQPLWVGNVLVGYHCSQCNEEVAGE